MSKVEGIFNFLKLPTDRLTTLFLNYSVTMFDEALLPLQAEDPKIHVLQTLCSLIKSILTKFVKPSAMLYKSLKAQ